MHFVSLALCLVGSAAVAIGAPGRVGARFSVDQVRNPQGSRNGPAEYAYAHVKYGFPVPEGLAETLRSKTKANLGDVGEIPAWTQGGMDIEYLSPVFVGDPPQMVFLNFDTGSADTWMYKEETNGQRFYNPENSKSSKIVENATWSIRYGDGSTATGKVWRDVMAIGDVQIPNMVVQTADEASSFLTQDVNMSGLAGLCANHKSTVAPKMPNLLDMLEPILDEHLFTADLRWHDNGRYRFGHIVKEDFEGELVYVPTNSSSKYWEINVSGIGVQHGRNGIWYFSDWSMIVDTGTTLNLLPKDLADLYWDQVNGSHYSPMMDGYIFACNTSDSLPDWHFDIGGFRGAVPGHYMNYMEMEREGAEYEGMCYGGIQRSPFGIDMAILGDIFLKAVYAVFDIKNKQIGFATKKLWA